MIQPHFFETPEKTALAVTQHLIDQLETMMRPFFLAVSGGSTPNLLFSMWGNEFADRIKWQRLHLFWVDERCVAPTDPKSNYGNMKMRCLDKIHIPVENIHRICGEAPPNLEAERYTLEVNNLLPLKQGIPQFDMILAGMGEDGHTSSIFPGQTSLLTEKQTYVVSKHPVTGQQRIAMTGPVMMQARELIFHVTGASKKALIKAMLHPTAEQLKLPAIYIAHHAKNAKLFCDIPIA
ncbi:MAG: 6-phosphogluconolactonase [Microbacter sp.]